MHLNQIENKHFPIINALRGIAALSVCLFHYICTVTGFINNHFVLDIFQYGRYGVQMFFVISGIVIPLSLINNNYSVKKFPRFFLKRLIRLEPPYLVAIVLGILYSVVRNFVPGTNQVDITPSLKEVFLHLGYLIPFFDGARWISPVFWTLAIEFQYYIFLGIAFPLIASQKLYIRSIAYLIFLFSALFSINRIFLFVHLPIFLLGINVCLYLLKKISFYEFLIIYILSCIMILFYHTMIDLIAANITVLSVLFIRNYQDRITSFLGKISYSIYIIHPIFGTAFINYTSHIVHDPWQKLLVIITGVTITIFSSYVIYKVIEEPSKKLSSKIKI